jgi:hypothetical protein
MFKFVAHSASDYMTYINLTSADEKHILMYQLVHINKYNLC